MKIQLILVAFFLFSKSALGAADLMVPQEYETISEAVAASESGDRIVMSSGTHLVSANIEINHTLAFLGVGESKPTIDLQTFRFANDYQLVGAFIEFKNLIINVGDSFNQALIFNGDNSLSVEDCFFTGLGQGAIAVYSEVGGNLYIKNSEFHNDCYTSIWSTVSGNLHVENSVFDTAYRAIAADGFNEMNEVVIIGNEFTTSNEGISLPLSQSLISDNVFSVGGHAIRAFKLYGDNSIECNSFLGCNSAIYIGNYTEGATLSAAHNNFIDCDIGVENYTLQSFNFAQNYWGATSGPTHPQNPNGTGASIVITAVIFTPWLTAPHDCHAPPVPSANISMAKIFGTRLDPIGKVVATLSKGENPTGLTFCLQRSVNGSWVTVASEIAGGSQIPILVDNMIEPYGQGTVVEYRVYVIDQGSREGPFSESEIASVAADINSDGVVNRHDAALYRNSPFDMDCDDDVDAVDRRVFRTWLARRFRRS